MAEFSLAYDEFTHDALPDKAHQRSVWGDGVVTISRFGIFSFYQINSTGSLGEGRILPQPQAEIRLIFVSKGKGIEVGCHAEMRTLSAGESNCLLVKEECKQDLSLH